MSFERCRGCEIPASLDQLSKFLRVATAGHNDQTDSMSPEDIKVIQAAEDSSAFDPIIIDGALCGRMVAEGLCDRLSWDIGTESVQVGQIDTQGSGSGDEALGYGLYEEE